MRLLGLLVLIAATISISVFLMQAETSPEEETHSAIKIPPWYRIEILNPDKRQLEVWHILPGGRVEWVRLQSSSQVIAYAEPAILGYGIYQAIDQEIQQIPATSAPPTMPLYTVEIIAKKSKQHLYPSELPKNLTAILSDIRQTHQALKTTADEAFLYLRYGEAPTHDAQSSSLNGRFIEQGISNRQIIHKLDDTELSQITQIKDPLVFITEELAVSGHLAVGVDQGGTSAAPISQE